MKDRLCVIVVFATFGMLNIGMDNCRAWQEPKVGFEPADTDRSGGVSPLEMEIYLSDRLHDEDLRHGEIFANIDADKNGSISKAEFENRHEAIENAMGAGYLGGDAFDHPDDPGKDFVPCLGLDQPTHDGKIMGAVFHRFIGLVEDASIKWPPRTKLSRVPESLDVNLVQQGNFEEPSVRNLIDATVIVSGGNEMGFFTAGAVLISEDGLALTNYHVAEFLEEGKMAGMTADGKCHPVVEFLAGNQDRDVALIRLKGNGFSFVKVAANSPKVGDNLEMIHHSENRFFTYDRGYVMRHPVLGEYPWMEISADYAPGGSGCGIYNDKRELVGLVSIIQYGDGPTLAESLDMESDDESWFGQDGNEDDQNMQAGKAMLLVKHAVPLSAIRSLWKDSVKPTESKTQKAKRKLQSEGKPFVPKSLTENNESHRCC